MIGEDCALGQSVGTDCDDGDDDDDDDDDR